LGLLSLGIAVGIWCIVTYGGFIKPLFLPKPSDIYFGLQELIKNGMLPGSIWVSLWRITQAMFVTIAIGVPVGILMGSFPVIDALLRKFLDGGKSVPPTALIALVILWFGIEERAKVVFLVLGAIFYMVLMTRTAIRNVREEYVMVATDIGASPWQMIGWVLLPGALPQIWDGIIVCNGIMWTYVILAEFINAQSGLGYMINIAQRLNRSGEVFAGIIIIAVISALTDWLLRSVRTRFFNW
jgi:NitT/TauT family transport system permease protein